MIFSKLEEKQVKEIEKILIDANIRYQIYLDKNTLEDNKESLNNDIRHLQMPTLSTGFLAIEINDKDLAKFELTTIEKLKKLDLYIDDETFGTK